MSSTSQQQGFEKLGHNGYPVSAGTDGQPADVDGPPPPSYNETTMHGSSVVSNVGSSSSISDFQGAQQSATAARTEARQTPSASGCAHSNVVSVAPSTSRPAFPTPSTADERPRHQQPQPDPPHVLVPPSQPSGPGASTESFTRAPPRDLPYGPFPPAVLHARSTDLVHDGFPLEPPTCQCAPLEPHPFVTHDVNEDDWARFLHDVSSAGGLKPVDSKIADAAPRAMRTGLLIGFIADMALRAHVEGKKKSPVADVIAEWNKHFFHPRSMEVVLAQGAVTYSGSDKAPPPDMAWDAEHGSPDISRRHDDALHDDHHGTNGRGGMGLGRGGFGRPWGTDRGGASGMTHRGGRGGQRGLLGGLGGLRGGAGLGASNRRDPVEYSRDLQASAREKWRLVVSYKAPTL